jgi:hypothetical protein
VLVVCHAKALAGQGLLQSLVQVGGVAGTRGEDHVGVRCTGGREAVELELDDRKRLRVRLEQ